MKSQNVFCIIGGSISDNARRQEGAFGKCNAGIVISVSWFFVVGQKGMF